MVWEVAIVAGGLASKMTNARTTMFNTETSTFRSRMLPCIIAPGLGSVSVGGSRTVHSTISRQSTLVEQCQVLGAFENV